MINPGKLVNHFLRKPSLARQDQAEGADGVCDFWAFIGTGGGMLDDQRLPENRLIVSSDVKDKYGAAHSTRGITRRDGPSNRTR